MRIRVLAALILLLSFGPTAAADGRWRALKQRRSPIHALRQKIVERHLNLQKSDPSGRHFRCIANVRQALLRQARKSRGLWRYRGTEVEEILLKNSATIRHRFTSRGSYAVEGNSCGRSGNNFIDFSPDIQIEPRGAPSDPMFVFQWGLYNDGSLDASAVPGIDIDMFTGSMPNLSSAWELPGLIAGSGAANQVIAMFDTAVDPHSDLNTRLQEAHLEDGPTNEINVKPQGNPDPGTASRHGTAVAGIIGAELNSEGIVGINLLSKILPISVSDINADPDTEFFLSDITAALQYANQKKREYIDSLGTSGYDIRVFNLSFGARVSCKGSNPALTEFLAQVDEANQNHILIVGATSNDDTHFGLGEEDIPTTCNKANLIAVTSVDFSGNLSNKASYGASEISLAAPGDKIASLAAGGSTGFFSGTSFATAHVSGAASLLFSNFPNLCPAQVVAILEDSSLDLGLDVASGGIIQIRAALIAAGKIAPGLQGDFDQDCDVDGVDLQTWEENFGSGSGGDTDGDGDTDGIDFLNWQRNFTGGQNPEPTIDADFDNDGDVDGADLATWESSFGTDDGADADGDGDSDGFDFLAWQRSFGQ